MPRDGRFARELWPRLPGAASPSKVASRFLQQHVRVSAQSKLLIFPENKGFSLSSDGLISCFYLRLSSTCMCARTPQVGHRSSIEADTVHVLPEAIGKQTSFQDCSAL